MSVEDVLIGSSKVRVETEEDSFEYEKDGQDVICNELNVPEAVEDALRSEGFNIVNQFPKTVTMYVHDEASPYDYDEVADELGLETDHELVQTVANVGYEIELKIEVTENGTAYLTHVDGVRLEDRKKLY